MNGTPLQVEGEPIHSNNCFFNKSSIKVYKCTAFSKQGWPYFKMGST